MGPIVGEQLNPRFGNGPKTCGPKRQGVLGFFFC
jgi:hypothetical protein